MAERAGGLSVWRRHKALTIGREWWTGSLSGCWGSCRRSALKARVPGKTWTARRWARTVYNLDDPPTLALVTADPHRLVSSEPPVLIDEWQRFPASWDLVRRAVDDDPSPGRFLLTGSAAPSSGPTHSGAGRIVTVRMRPMSLAERGTETPSVSLSDLLDGERPAITGQTSVGLGAYAHEIVAGGFPGLAGIEHEALTQALDGYLHRAVDHDVALMGHRVRNPATMRRWLTAYAAATATTASYETILDAATAQVTTGPYAYRDQDGIAIVPAALLGP